MRQNSINLNKIGFVGNPSPKIIPFFVDLKSLKKYLKYVPSFPGNLFIAKLRLVPYTRILL